MSTNKTHLTHLRRALDDVHEALGRAVASAMTEPLTVKILDETTRPVRVLALPSQPVEITWLDAYGNIVRVETRTFEP